MSESKTYLGDGVYADHDGYNVVLTAENGIRATNTIFLEPSVVSALEAFVRRVRPATPHCCEGSARFGECIHA